MENEKKQRGKNKRRKKERKILQNIWQRKKEKVIGKKYSGPGLIPDRSRSLLFHSVQTGSGAHPASYQIGAEGDFPRGQPPGREADHSPSSSV
jgi:hypothetical protein